MRKKPFPFRSTGFIQRLVHAYGPLLSRGFWLDGPAHVAALRSSSIAAPSQSNSTSIPCEGLGLFITRLQELLAATDESSRQQLEVVVLNLAVALRATGLFEVLNVADPAVATMINEHLTETLIED